MAKHKPGVHHGHAKGHPKLARSTPRHNGKHATNIGSAPARHIRKAGSLKAPKGGKSSRLAGVKL